MERPQLVQVRKWRLWTVERAAREIGVDKATLSRWEKGLADPQPSNVERLCRAYSMTPEALGFGYDAPAQQATDMLLPFQQQDLTLRLMRLVWQWSPRTATYHQLQASISQELEMEESLSRRDALRRLALLPIEMSGLSLASAIVKAPERDILAQCAAGLTACWNLRKGRELTDVARIVSCYIPTLHLITQSSTALRKAAADLLAQCYLLKCLLAWHVETHAESITYAQKSANYSEIAGNVTLQILALRTQAAAHYYADHWSQALHTAEQARNLMETVKSVTVPAMVRSYVYAGLATYQAHAQMKQEAFTSLGKARAAFFAHPDEPVPVWVDHYTGNLVLNDGRTHFHLGMQKEALSAFTQIHSDPAGSAAIRVEALLNEAIAEVYRAGSRDMDWVIDRWTAGIEGAKTLQSEQRFSEALSTYAAMRAAWPAEPRINALRERIAHW